MSRPRFLRSSWLQSKLLRLLDWLLVIAVYGLLLGGIVVALVWLEWL